MNIDKTISYILDQSKSLSRNPIVISSLCLSHSILYLTEQLKQLKEDLCFGRGAPMHHPGNLEHIAISLRDIADKGLTIHSDND